MSNEDLINGFLERKKQGESYSEIRIELENLGYNPEDIKRIIRQIDELILAENNKKSSDLKSKEYRTVGIVLIAIGLLVTLGSLTGLIPMPGYFTILIGPIVIGVFMFLGAKNIGKSNKISNNRRFGKR